MANKHWRSTESEIWFHYPCLLILRTSSSNRMVYPTEMGHELDAMGIVNTAHFCISRLFLAVLIEARFEYFHITC